ncbi:class I SAM-dependent methyltransferase [Primorskyibacter aestuariivivens]|uniref:class I SAM-dependent methyltransferase n=1 Tax=Primorskyibacter aestuariivivens TaxID=1888912 RepID=UPI002301AC0F|nr:class I SAM-dependent methyltransferase [Primorskyibacter aestuariivivens]MDA7427831.1 class I SAM-dependent methyltransferase [Primorskyibacter aestuariivivens]
MSDNAAKFTGDIPTHYDAGLGPILFSDFGDRLTATACAGKAKKVIELAAGTGIVSRKLRDSLPREASLLVTDLNAPMLEVARNKFSDGENVDFALANAMELDCEDGAFDLMVCQFGVMFFPDKPASFREAARVLKPGGRYVFNVFSAMQENPYSQIAYSIPAQFVSGEPPRFYKVPFHYGNPDAVREDLAAAGWRDITHETIRLRKKIMEPEAFARGLVYGNPLIDELRNQGGVDPETVAAAVLRALEVTFGPTDMTMPLEATIFSCTAT